MALSSRAFFLIGVHSTVADTAPTPTKGAIISIERDANVSTGKMDEVVTTISTVAKSGDFKSSTKRISCAVPPKFKMVKLSVYSPENFLAPRCSKAEVD